MFQMEEKSVRDFQAWVYTFYRQNRRDLPWRNTFDPYRILVSEMMLQQTQVERVIPKYLSFIEKFPDFQSLASATPGDIIREWQGLGYNRRAIYLYRIAERVVEGFGGSLPDSEETLRGLPGIGKATAAAIMAFAFGRPTILIETNIKAVFIHCFFPDDVSVTDRQIVPLVEMTLDRENPRDWYYALMDLGAALKKKNENPTRRSAHYHRQSPFEGSDRQIRGRILDILRECPEMEIAGIISRLEADPERAGVLLARLEKEGFLSISGETARLS
jgi:A/G-specific adenine glycosylase